MGQLGSGGFRPGSDWGVQSPNSHSSAADVAAGSKEEEEQWEVIDPTIDLAKACAEWDFPSEPTRNLADELAAAAQQALQGLGDSTTGVPLGSPDSGGIAASQARSAPVGSLISMGSLAATSTAHSQRAFWHGSCM
jgi:hypothetical protein